MEKFLAHRNETFFCATCLGKKKTKYPAHTCVCRKKKNQKKKNKEADKSEREQCSMHFVNKMYHRRRHHRNLA